VLGLLLAAAMCLTPQGHRLSLAGDFFRSTQELDDLHSRDEAMRWIAQRPGGWRKLALEAGEDPFVWPLGQWVYGITKDGRRVPAIEFFATTPAPQLRDERGGFIVRLGLEPLLIRPDKLQRLPYQGRTAAQLFARFPLEKIVRIEIGEHVPSGGR
jgi:hypothetical protein